LFTFLNRLLGLHHDDHDLESLKPPRASRALRFALSLRPLFPALIDAYLTHIIFASSTATLHLHAEKPRSLELVPVIARVPLSKRVFPHGRIVFEPRDPSAESATGVASEGGGAPFDGGELELRFPRGGIVVRLGLGVGAGTSERVHQYWRVEVGPVFVFLKGEEGGRVHCVSVPVEYLRGKLSGW
jgi:hypothetical protein